MKYRKLPKPHLFYILFILLSFGCNSGKKDWERAKQINTLVSFHEFLTTHPSNDYSKMARLKIDSFNYYMWPPQKLSSLPSNFVETPTLHFKDWLNVEVEGSGHMAFYTKKAKVKLQKNIFSISQPLDGFIESQFEVKYFDDQQTLIEADSTKNDKIVFIYLGPGNLKETYSFPGLRVRYQDRIYELRKDGWYIKNIRIHEF